MRLVLGHDDIVAAWMSSVTGQSFELYFTREGKPAQAVLGWANENGALLAAAIFNNHHENGSIEVHVCGRMSRQNIRDVFRYAFTQLNVQRLTAMPYRSGADITKIIKKLGGVYEGTMKRNYGPSKGDDALIFRIDRAAAEKWM